MAEYNNWNKLVIKIEDTCRNPHLFWKRIKIISAQKTPDLKYLLDEYNNELFTPKSQEEELSNKWDNVFHDDISVSDNGDEKNEKPQIHIFF